MLEKNQGPFISLNQVKLMFLKCQNSLICAVSYGLTKYCQHDFIKEWITLTHSPTRTFLYFSHFSRHMGKHVISCPGIAGIESLTSGPSHHLH